MRKISFCLVVTMIVSMLFSGAYATYIPEDNTDSDPTGKVVELEAEDFDFGNGFKVVEDASLSGGKGLCSVKAGAVADLACNFEYESNTLVMYVYHKAKDSKSNLSYVYFDDFDGESIYTTDYNKNVFARRYLGNAFGKYTLHIKAARPGHIIDKIVLKYNESIPEGQTLKNPVPGKPEYEDLEVNEVKEGGYNSFFFEAEGGTSNDGSTDIAEDENASGGFYWYSTASGAQTEPLSNDRFGSRTKFKVSTPGKYIMWLRYSTPASRQKSTWFGIDNENYVRLDRSAVEGWVWVKHTTVELGEGWHTLDIKYRQAGQKIDCVILTPLSSFKPMGKGSLPGEAVNPDAKSADLKEKAKAVSKLWVNNTRCRMDTNVIEEKGQIFIPTTNVSSEMSLEKYYTDEYVLLKRDRQYAKYYINENLIVINGKNYRRGYSCIKNGEFWMIPASSLKLAFDTDYEYDRETNNFYLFDDYSGGARMAREGEVESLLNFRKDLYLKIPHDNPNAKVRVWARANETDAMGYEKQNFFDNMKNMLMHGYEYSYTPGTAATEYKYSENWIECETPYYKDGAFYVRQAGFMIEGKYDVMVSITENGYEDRFIAKKAVDLVWTHLDEKTEAFKVNTGGELFAESTFENISYYIDYEGELSRCRVTYREADTNEEKEALEAFNDTKTKQFRGSVVKVKEGTEYELTARLYDSKNVLKAVKTAKIKTKSSDVPIAKEIKLSEIYDGEGALNIQNMHGSEDGWIKINCEGQTIDGGLNHDQAVYISESSYIIFENAVIRGGERFGINITNFSDNIRIINCDIAGWGPGDVPYNREMGVYYINGGVYNYCCGIKAYFCSNVLIERNYIHDANVQTNEWIRPDGKQIHPAGSSGIYLGTGGGVVIRYNDIIGSDIHRFNDAIEGSNNFGLNYSSLCRNSDIYGNMLIYTADDIMELDGAQMNIRVYENRAEQSLCGISTAANTMGPAYIFRNLYTNAGTVSDQMTGAMMKNGGDGPDGYTGRMYMFNNTFDSYINGMNAANGAYYYFSRNNIIASRKTDGVGKNNVITEGYEDYDYDLVVGTIAENKYLTNPNEHGLSILPEYVDMESGNFELADKFAAIDRGVNIPNFSDSYVTDGTTDIGAFEKGGDMKFLPYRPIDMWADKYSVTLTDDEVATIKVYTGDVKPGTKFSVLKNSDYSWLNILSEKTGILEANSTFEIQISADLSEYLKTDFYGYTFKDGNGMILIRTEDGYSIPITVYAK